MDAIKLREFYRGLSRNGYDTWMSINGTMRRNACFSGVSEEPFKLHICLDEVKMLNHQVIITKEQIRTWLKLIKRYFGGITSYEFVEKSDYPILDNNENHLIISVDLKTLKEGFTYTTTTVITACLRYLYEPKYSIILHKAFVMKEKHPEKTLMEWFLLVHTTEVVDDHSLIQSEVYNPDGKTTKYFKFSYKKYKELIRENKIEGRTRLFNEFPLMKDEEVTEIKQLFENEGISNWSK